MSDSSKWFVLFLFLATCRSAWSQTSFDGCVDFRGKPVASVLSTSLQDIAAATYDANGTPIILYNPYVLQWASPQTRLFFYAHECAHHVLAHGFQSRPLTQEQEADCWAIQYLAHLGLLSDVDIQIVQRDIALLGRGDWTHLPGPYRAINLRMCLAGFQ